VPSDEVDPAVESRAADAAMARYADGDAAAFAELYDIAAPRLQRYLLRRTHDGPRTDDLVQQTFLHLHRSRGRYIPGAPVMPWMYAIAHRLMIDAWRREGRQLPPDAGRPVPMAAPEGAVRAQGLAEQVGVALGDLPHAQRTAWELTRADGLSLSEAAEPLGTTVTAVKLRVHRANLAIRAALGGDWP
jgi:RNA polymerase sigma-70 factor (ECF subfamily)